MSPVTSPRRSNGKFRLLAVAAVAAVCIIVVFAVDLQRRRTAVLERVEAIVKDQSDSDGLRSRLLVEGFEVLGSKESFLVHSVVTHTPSGQKSFETCALARTSVPAGPSSIFNQWIVIRFIFSDDLRVSSARLDPIVSPYHHSRWQGR